MLIPGDLFQQELENCLARLARETSQKEQLIERVIHLRQKDALLQSMQTKRRKGPGEYISRVAAKVGAAWKPLRSRTAARR